MAEHPSFLELDRLHLGSGTPEVKAHVDGCESCRAHLRSLEQPSPMPAWATALSQEAPRPRWRFWEGWSAPLQILVPAAVAMALLVAVLPRHAPGPGVTEAEIGVKGGPSLALYIKRGEQVLTWDGQAPVQPGDKLRLQVAAAGYRFVAVTSDDSTLYAGALDPTQPSFLPESWSVDAQPGSERLAVALSQKPLSPSELHAALASRQRDAAVWTSELELAKVTP